MNLKFRINGDIRASEVRVVYDDGEQEVLRIQDAIKKALQNDLDLIEVQPNANPPVCKIVDVGKFLYEHEKKEKEQKKRQKNIAIKEIRFHPNIDDHDFDFKVSHAMEFLIKRGRVRITIVFAGRQIIYKDQGYSLLKRVTERLEIVGKLEGEPKLEGKFLYAYYIPEKHKVELTEKKREKEEKMLKEMEQKDRDERVRKLKEAEAKRKSEQKI